MTFILLLVDFFQPVQQLEDLRCRHFVFNKLCTVTTTVLNRKHEEVLTFSIWLKSENNRISCFPPRGLMSEAFKGEQQKCIDTWIAKLPSPGLENFVNAVSYHICLNLAGLQHSRKHGKFN